jgi:hypothetical protein
MYTKEMLDDLLKRFSTTLDISEELFKKAESEYEALGKWIDAETPDYSISIYPQGSFALGTVIKPLSDADEYDLDLVCEFDRQYGLSARELKIDVVKPLLINYRRITGDILEKRRCWHVEYEEIPQFHMDVIPAIMQKNYIHITDHNEDEDVYEYIGSNPEGYIEWFYSRMEDAKRKRTEKYIRESKMVLSQAEIEEIKRYRVKTSLQRAIQILKRHRDMFFQQKDSCNKPTSIIITTIAAQLYNNEDSIVEALVAFLSNANQYIMTNIVDGEYHIPNPSYPTENFADKWNEHPERAKVFFDWLEQCSKDLIDESLLAMKRVQLAENMSRALGKTISNKVFGDIAKEEMTNILSGSLKVDTTSGAIKKTGTVNIPPNRHHG